MLIRNRADLLSHGNVEARRHVLDILETGLAAADPYVGVMDVLRLEGNILTIGTETMPPGPLDNVAWLDTPRPFERAPLVIDLDQVGDIYVIGGGKAAQRQAQAIEDLLGERITDGQINAKKGDQITLVRIPVTLAGHPIPDEESVLGSQRMLDMAQRFKANDLVFFSSSGGGSALMCLPAPGVSLEDLQAVNRILYFEHGASMPETNAVRNLASVIRMKYNRFVPQATYIFLWTDERPRDLDVLLDYCPLGQEAYDRAIGVLHKYDCWQDMPQSIRDFLLRGDPAYGPLRPDEWWHKRHFCLRIMGPEVMLAKTQAKAASMGLDCRILASSLANVEANAIGQTAAYIAQEIEAHNQPCAAPAALLIGGELVVSTGKTVGLGGRNQEFALAAAARIAGSQRIVIASVDSDGGDGPTPFAGGIVDGMTMARAKVAGLDVAAALRRHDSCGLLSALGDSIDTGVLKTNVQDLRVIYVGESL